MQGAMDTYRTMIRWGSFVFVLLSLATCSSLLNGLVAGVIRTVFSSELLLKILEKASG